MDKLTEILQSLRCGLISCENNSINTSEKLIRQRDMIKQARQEIIDLVPNKQKGDFRSDGNYETAYYNGWNACRKEILERMEAK